MKNFVQNIKSAIILGGLLIVLPTAVLADKGGKPNVKSTATTAVCIVDDGSEDDGSAHVYSCKTLSNVVLWCGGTYIKYDDLGVDPVTNLEQYDGIFGCGEAEGDITFVAIKSGSQKHKKHNPGYTSPVGLPPDEPSGSGLFVGDIPLCGDLADVPMPGVCEVVTADPPPDPDTN